jgi:uncharacterized protein YndB with AHSA1/START domain
MAENLTATATTTINATTSDVWDALVTPEAIKQYMFGAQVVSDWREGSDIVWKGEWQGRPYEDKGVILKYQPDRVLQYSHFSPLSGAADVQENYHTVTIKLDRAGEQTRVMLTQDKNASEEEREHSRKNWEMMLRGLKKYVED